MKIKTSKEMTRDGYEMAVCVYEVPCPYGGQSTVYSVEYVPAAGSRYSSTGPEGYWATMDAAVEAANDME